MEDSDIKIFGKEQNAGNDELKFIALMEKERSNGNIDEAVRLGDYLSDIFLDEEGLLQRLAPFIGNTDFPRDAFILLLIPW